MLVRYFYNGDADTMLKELEQAEPLSGSLFAGTDRASAFPPLNVYSSEDGYTITAEIPGVDPEKLEIMVSEDTVTIAGNREAEEMPGQAALHRREREFGEFSRTIRLPYKVDDDGVSAKAANGILRLTIAKPAAQKPVRVPVKAA